MPSKFSAPYCDPLDSSEVVTRLDNYSVDDLRSMIRTASPSNSLNGIYYTSRADYHNQSPPMPPALSRTTSIDSSADFYTRFSPFSMPTPQDDLRYSVYDDGDKNRGASPSGSSSEEEESVPRTPSSILANVGGHTWRSGSSDYAQYLADIHAQRFTRFQNPEVDAASTLSSPSMYSVESAAPTITSLLIRRLIRKSSECKPIDELVPEQQNEEYSEPIPSAPSSPGPAPIPVDDVTRAKKKPGVYMTVYTGVIRVLKRKTHATRKADTDRDSSGLNVETSLVTLDMETPAFEGSPSPPTVAIFPVTAYSNEVVTRSSASIFGRKRKGTMNSVITNDIQPPPSPSPPNSRSYFRRAFSIRRGKPKGNGQYVDDQPIELSAQTANRKSARRSASFSGYANYDFTIDPEEVGLVRTALRWADEE